MSCPDPWAKLDWQWHEALVHGILARTCCPFLRALCRLRIQVDTDKALFRLLFYSSTVASLYMVKLRVEWRRRQNSIDPVCLFTCQQRNRFPSNEIVRWEHTHSHAPHPQYCKGEIHLLSFWGCSSLHSFISSLSGLLAWCYFLAVKRPLKKPSPSP